METQFLPPPNPTLPFWLTDRSPLDQIRSTPDLPSESDIVIIGAGYAGISLAYHLLRSAQKSGAADVPSITILEARTVCSGATGRNGGHVRPDTYSLIPLYMQRHGIHAAAKSPNSSSRTSKLFKTSFARKKIEYCDFLLTQNMNVYLNQKKWQ